MDLYLMRHGKAEEDAPSDAERKLTVEGAFHVEDVADAFLKREWPLPKKLITSPYNRAEETARIIAKKLGIKDVKVVSYEEAILWEKMRSYVNNEPILFVGHQPFLGEVIERLTNRSLSVRKASIHRIKYDFEKDTGKYVDKIESR